MTFERLTTALLVSSNFYLLSNSEFFLINKKSFVSFYLFVYIQYTFKKKLILQQNIKQIKICKKSTKNL